MIHFAKNTPLGQGCFTTVAYLSFSHGIDVNVHMSDVRCKMTIQKKKIPR